MKKIKKAIKWIKENYDTDVYEYYDIKKGDRL